MSFSTEQVMIASVAMEMASASISSDMSTVFTCALKVDMPAARAPALRAERLPRCTFYRDVLRCTFALSAVYSGPNHWLDENAGLQVVQEKKLASPPCSPHWQ